MEKSKLELSVGITSIIGIVILVLGSLWGKDVGFASRQQQVVFSFANSGGLRPGDPVTVNGVKKGRVEEIVLRQNEVLVTARLEEDVQLFEDIDAKIAMLDLMGGNKLEISPGISNRPLQNGTPVRPVIGSEVVGIGEMFAEAYRLKPKVDTLLISMQMTMDELGLLLASDKLRTPLHNSLQDMASLSNELRSLLTETKPKLKNTLEQVQSASATMNALLSENQHAMQSSMTGLARVTAKMDTITTALQDIMAVMTAREGTVGKLIYEDEVYQRLQHTVNGVDSLTIELRKSLGKYLNGVDIKLLNLIDF